MFKTTFWEQQNLVGGTAPERPLVDMDTRLLTSSVSMEKYGRVFSPLPL